MDDNPFRSPETVNAPVLAQVADGKQMRSGRDLRAIASSQRLIMFAIVGYFALLVFAGVLRPRNIPGATMVVGFIAIATVLCGLFGIIRLAANLYRSTLVGILNGVVMFLPLIGLFVLVILNMRATRILKKHGIRVGLMGANSSDLQAIPD